jgi:SAM-dependent methyltransferase
MGMGLKKLSNNGRKDVRAFYDQIGWKMESDGFYQNARYEDLRPVSREYIDNCHLRINRHLVKDGKYLLDAGSGPIQYPAYLTYMEGYQYRVCADISIVALKEARNRIKQRGLFVVCDVADMPFKSDTMDGIVSLHTLHHLPLPDQKKAYYDLYRTLKPGKKAAVVNGWTESALMKKWFWLVKLMEKISYQFKKLGGGVKISSAGKTQSDQSRKQTSIQTGTFVEKLNEQWLIKELPEIPFSIFVWRSVSVRFMRAVIHAMLAGKLWLKILYWLEEKNPRFYGINGQYPLIVIHKPEEE